MISILKMIRNYLRAARRWTKAFIFKAKGFAFPRKVKYFCPCCRTGVPTFVEGQFRKHPERYDPSRYVHAQQDVLCPVCFSAPRHRILASWCGANIKKLQSATILYFAPEESMMRWMKKSNVSCTSADLIAPADLKLDIQNTKLPDQSYDAIFCNHVLEHVDDFRKALKELYRILRFGGYLICSFPMDLNVEVIDETEDILSETERIRRFGQVDHKRIFGMNADRLLIETGFIVEKISGEDYPKEILPVVGPADYDMNCLFVCRKN